MKDFDYLLKNGTVIDPANKREGIFDVAIKGGKIAAVEENIAPDRGETVVDVTGLYVTPGLIDAHIHCYYSAGIPKAWAGDFSLQPDYFNFSSGVTSMVDTGSAGSANFDHFRTTVIDRCKTKVYALLNIADYGMATLYVEQFPEKNSMKDFISCCEKHPDVIKGIKIAHYWGKDWADVDFANKAKEALNLPIMVDFGVFKPERPYDQLLLEKLSAGDISTHCFRGPVPVVDENNQLYPYLRTAREKGILFDLGHGAGSFLFRNAVPAMEQGFYPDTVSTDLHALSMNNGTYSLCSVMSKMMACCDISLHDLISCVTVNPKKMFHLENTASLTVGEPADIAVLNLLSGEFGFRDVGEGRATGKWKLDCEMTFCDGKVVYDLNARTCVDYKTLGNKYGFDPSQETLITPTRV